MLSKSIQFVKSMGNLHLSGFPNFPAGCRRGGGYHSFAAPWTSQQWNTSATQSFDKRATGSVRSSAMKCWSFYRLRSKFCKQFGERSWKVHVHIIRIFFCFTLPENCEKRWETFQMPQELERSGWSAAKNRLENCECETLSLNMLSRDSGKRDVYIRFYYYWYIYIYLLRLYQ